MKAAAELAAYEIERARRVELETIPAGLRPLSPLWRPRDRQDAHEPPAGALRRYE